MPRLITFFPFVFILLGLFPAISLTATVQVDMVQPGCIGGVVTDTGGSLTLAGSLVEALQNSMVMGEDTTDTLGLYEIQPLDPGTYDAIASKEGYLSDTVMGIVVTAGLCTPVNFQLEPVPIKCGDVNGDERVTGADRTYILAYIYFGGGTPMCLPIEACADVNLDGRITGADGTYIVNYIYMGGSPPCEIHSGSNPVRDEKRIER